MPKLSETASINFIYIPDVSIQTTEQKKISNNYHNILSNLSQNNNSDSKIDIVVYTNNLGAEQLKFSSLKKINFVNITTVYDLEKSAQEKFTTNPKKFYNSASAYKILISDTNTDIRKIKLEIKNNLEYLISHNFSLKIIKDIIEYLILCSQEDKSDKVCIDFDKVGEEQNFRKNPNVLRKLEYTKYVPFTPELKLNNNLEHIPQKFLQQNSLIFAGNSPQIAFSAYDQPSLIRNKLLSSLTSLLDKKILVRNILNNKEYHKSVLSLIKQPKTTLNLQFRICDLFLDGSNSTQQDTAYKNIEYFMQEMKTFIQDKFSNFNFKKINDDKNLKLIQDFFIELVSSGHAPVKYYEYDYTLSKNNKENIPYILNAIGFLDYGSPIEDLIKVSIPS